MALRIGGEESAGERRDQQPWILSRARVDDPVARGVAVGTTAHGQGAAAMLHEGELQGALAGAALALAAVFTSVIAPFLIPWLVHAGS
jgi:putative effector of murein hydrolase